MNLLHLILACPNCNPPIEHQSAKAVASAIWVMIGITGFVLAFMTTLIVSVIRTVRKHEMN